MNIDAIGLEVRRRRAVLCIDQKTLSDLSGVAVHTVSNIEAGRGNPTVATLQKVLGALGMELQIDLRHPEAGS
jgi:transcriptional regulator with XRE-family HTH domain